MATSPAHIPLRRKIRNLLLITLITLLLFEITLRVYEAIMDTPKQELLHIYQPNPTGSMRLLPNLHQPVTVEGRPFTLVTNSQGLAWRETNKEKPTQKTRIAFLGDSFTQGMWSPSLDSCFVGIAEKQTPGVECVNFGVGGYGVADMRLMLEEEVFAYHPDQVVLIFFNGNDYHDTYEGLLNEAEVTPKWNLSAFLYQQIALARFGIGLVNRVRYREHKAEDLLLDLPDFEVAGELEWIRKTYDDRQQLSVEATLMELDTIRSQCQAQGIPLWLAALPCERQVYIETFSGEDWSLDQPQSYLEKWCREEDVPYLDLMPGLRRAARSTEKPLYFKTEQHLTPEGHVVVGQLLGDWLRQ